LAVFLAFPLVAADCHWQSAIQNSKSKIQNYEKIYNKEIGFLAVAI